MYIKSDYKTFINKRQYFDFYIIDPPWKYKDINPGLQKNQLTYNLWDNNKENMQII